MVFAHQIQLMNTEIDMSPSLAYIVGVIVSDGCVFKSTAYTTRLDAMDKDFVEEFVHHLKAIDPTHSPCLYQSKRGSWIGAVGSKRLYLTLKHFDFEKMNTATIEEKKMFLRAFFDGEGTAYRIPRTVSCCNTKKDLILLIQKLLADLNIKGNLYTQDYIRKRNKNTIYHIGIYGYKNLHKFSELIGFTICRKQERLNRLLNSYTRGKKL